MIWNKLHYKGEITWKQGNNIECDVCWSYWNLPMDKNAMIGVSQFTEQKNCDTPILYFKKKLKEVYDEKGVYLQSVPGSGREECGACQKICQICLWKRLSSGSASFVFSTVPKGFLNAILFAFSVRGREGLWKRLWLTTSNRIGVIRFCFGMRVTGSRFASTTMTWRQWPRTGIRNINIDCVSYTRVGVLNLHNPVQDWPPPPQTWIFAELSRGDSPAVWYFSQNVFKCKGNPSESFDKKYRKTVFLMGKKAQKEVLFYPFFMPVWMEGCERIWRSSRQSR